MRHASIALVMCFVVGCANGSASSSAKSGANGAAPAPTPLPHPSSEIDEARVPPTPTPASEPVSEVETASPVAAAAPCSLKATLRETATRSSGRRFSLTLTNQGNEPLRLVAPGDGSGEGWRTPVLSWSAKDAHGKEVARKPAARCGFMNRIAPKEVFTLAPGATRDLGEWISWPPFEPGTYDVRLTYKNDPRLASKGGESEEVKKLLASSSACEVTSNALRATIPS